MITKKFIFSIIVVFSLVSFQIVSAEEVSGSNESTNTSDSQSTLDKSSDDDTAGKISSLDNSADDSTTGGQSDKLSLLDGKSDDDTTGEESKDSTLDNNADDDTTGSQIQLLSTLDQNADDDTTGDTSKSSLLDDQADDDTTGTAGNGFNDLLDENADDDTVGSEGNSTTTPPTDNGDNSNGGRRIISSGGSSNRGNTSGRVLGATTDGESCGLYLNEYLKYGANNNTAEVLKLQAFLNEFIGSKLILTGVFDEATFVAVKELQALYSTEILQPWVDAGTVSFLEPTGYVYKTTRYFINTQKCKELNLMYPNLREEVTFVAPVAYSAPATGGEVLSAQVFNGKTCGIYLHDYLREDFSNDPVEVRKLQEFLNEFNDAKIDVNGIFDNETDNAVRGLQARYSDEILKPWVQAGIAVTLDTTGYVFKTTQHFINTHKCPELNLAFPEL